jgi:uncharacterized protein YidB (DUF937 family)
MSLFADLAKAALNQLGGSQNQGGSTQAELLQLAGNLIQQHGGIEGLMAKFGQAGLGEHISSWIGNGSNLPITPEQIKQVLGSHIEQYAQQTGQDGQSVAAGLSQILPGLIDKLTPNGQPVGGSELESGLSAALEGGLGKLFGSH